MNGSSADEARPARPARNPARRRAIGFACAGLAACVAPALRAADPFPGGPVRIVVPAPAGGGLDAVSRRVAARLAEYWGVPVVVENRTGGAGGSIAAALVARARADGLTILSHTTPLVQVPWLHKLPYDALRDLVPASQMTGSPSILCVGPTVPANTFEEFVALVRASPGKLSYGSWGHTTTTHLQAALLCRQAGLDMIHVPFQGSAPVIVALLGGHVTAGFVDPGSASRYAGSLKVLAVTGKERSRQAPAIPTLAEKGLSNFDLNNWTGLFVPAGTPSAAVAKISDDVGRALREREVLADLEKMNLVVVPGTAEQFRATVERDHAAWGEIIRIAGVTAQS